LPDTNVRDRILAYDALGSNATITEAAAKYGNSGYVAESVPLAIFAAGKCRELGFEGMLEQIISAGGDTDTNASIAGQIAGARLGLSGLPAALIERLPEHEMVFEVSRAFAEYSFL
jgi:ADP-ribosylglycohydrolase